MGKGIALLSLIAGVALGAAALDLLPPRYVILDARKDMTGAIGALLAFAGLAALSKDHRGSDLLTAFILLGFSLLTGWITFYGPESLVEGSLERFPASVRESFGQLMFGVGVVVCGVTAYMGLRRLVR